MKKEELLKQLKEAQEVLKDHNKFITLFKDKEDPERILLELNRTLARIEMLVHAIDIKSVKHPEEHVFKKEKAKLVSIRPCNEKYGNKTYLGFLIGDVALGTSLKITEDRIQLGLCHYNPAIYVPELGEVIYGIESWWGEIESEDELKEITDDDIENVWYMKFLKNHLKNES